MKGESQGYGYNERLFSGGWRRPLHLARFHWVARELARLGHPTRSILEIGCFDGKLLDYLPEPPARYLGCDANWDGGLDLARERRGDRPGCTFRFVETAADLGLGPDDVFDAAIAMETLEHLVPDVVESYLHAISDHLEGHLLVTVPNEKGLILLSKYLTKYLLGSRDTEYATYTFREVANATLKRMDRFDRYARPGCHLGFDYDWLVNAIRRRFEVVKVEGVQFPWLPLSFNVGIGILARSRARPPTPGELQETRGRTWSNQAARSRAYRDGSGSNSSVW